MEIIELKSNQLISECDLVKITIGEYEGNWALESVTVTTRGDEICHEDEAHEIRGDYYHENEFNDFDIVYDEYHCCYELKSNCYHGYINQNDEGYFSQEADYVVFDDDYYMDSDVAEDHEIYFCSYCDMRFHTDYGCECSEEEENSNEACFEYHSDNREDFSKDSKFKIGFEVEKEDAEVKEEDTAYDLFRDTGWAKERDGSLGCGGFELISPVLPLDISIPINEQPDIRGALDSVSSYIDAEYTKNCGGHINLSCQDTSSTNLLESIGGYLPLFYSMYENRIENTYSFAKSLKKYTTERAKYSSFNCKRDGVLEIRIFPAVKNMSNLLWRTELLRIMLANSTKSYKTALMQIANPKNELHQHLLKVFDKQQLFNKVKLFVKYAAQFDAVKFNQKTINRNLGKIYKVA